MNNKATAINRPIRIGLLFSVFTIILFEFGVYNWDIPNRLLFYLFLIVCHIAMYYGFTEGTKKIEVIAVKRQISINKVVKFLFWIALILAIPKYFLFTGERSLNLSSIIAKISQLSTDALTLYQEKGEVGSATGIWRYINWIVVLFSPFHWAYILLSMYYWNKLSLFTKIGTVIIWFMWVAQYLVTGTNVGVFLFVINLTTIVLIKRSDLQSFCKSLLYLLLILCLFW